MARFNEILVGRYNRALQKTFGMKGGPPSPQLATEIQPNISMFWGNECRYLEGWQKFATNINQGAGGAGTRAGFRIDNPKGSNVLAVIEKISLISVVGTDGPFINYSIISAGNFANIVITTNTGLDNRGPQSPQLQVTSQATAAALIGVTIFSAPLAANQLVDVLQLDLQELPLLPNSSYTFYSNTLNQAFGGNLWWRERPLEPSEIT
jgi:hypothetical protein